MSKEYLTTTIIDDHILEVTLDRPPVNALTYECYKEIGKIFKDTVEDTKIRVVILCANGRIFCAGQDVNDIVNDSPEKTILRRATLKQAMENVYNCPVPIICLVNGGAVGAGCILAASSDIVVASEDAFFSLPEIDVGIVGGGAHLSRILPIPKARYMALTGERVSAKEFYRLGAIEAVVRPEELQKVGLDYARKLASKSPITMRKWKQSFTHTENLNVLEGFSIEQKLTQEISEHQDSKTAPKSFLNKTVPKYTSLKQGNKL